MAENIGSFLHALVHDWPRWLRITLVTVVIVFLCLIVTGTFAVLLSRQYNVDLKNMKVTQPETEKTKNCRSESASAAVYDQGINARILSYETQLSALDRDLAERRQKCLTEMSANPSPTQREAGCSIPSRGLMNDYDYSGASGRYRPVLLELAQEKTETLSRITALEEQQRQGHQRLSQLCSSSETGQR